MTRLIDADELLRRIPPEEMMARWAISEAPTVPLPDFKEGYQQAIRDGQTNYSRPHGKWVECDGFCECSECQHREDNDRFIWNDMNFCSTCGAYMEADNETDN